MCDCRIYLLGYRVPINALHFKNVAILSRIYVRESWEESQHEDKDMGGFVEK
jgi:hypothetical protein